MTTEDQPVAIAAEPKAGQTVEHDGKVYTTVREGKAFILVPPKARTSVDPKSKAGDGSQAQDVFYNPIQQFNRDLSVLAIKAFAEDSCKRKRERHEAQGGKTKRKKDNKRKRAAVEGAHAEEDGNPTKVSRSEDGSRETAAGQEGDDVQVEHTSGKTRQEDATVEGDQARAEAAQEANGVLPSEAQASEGAAQTGTPTNDPNQNGDAAQGQSKQPWKPRFRILDALSATGLRALRYATEIPDATAVVANDREKKATKSINLNVEHNKLDSMITTTTSDALGHMYSVAYPPPESHGPKHINGRYDVVDLDPYGTAAPFIDAALQALEDGGLLCVTCTDSGVFASCGYSEKTFSLYGGMPIKGIHSHEGGLRLILSSIATTASKYGLAIEPLLSLSIDFYARVFVRVRKSPLDVKFLAGKTMFVYDCDHGCGAWTTQFIGRHVKHKDSNTNWKYTIAQAPIADSTCEHCGSKMHLAGPMWGGPLHNPAFIEKILDDLKGADAEVYKTKPRIEGMLDTALDEMVVNPETMDFRNVNTKTGEREIIPRMAPELIDRHPFFFIPSALCKVIKAQAPAEALIKGALRHAGYKVTRSHCKPGSIKTDAPWAVIWEVFREWARQKSPVKEGALQEVHPGWKILQAMRKSDDDRSISTGNEKAKPEAHGNGTAEGTPDIVTEDKDSGGQTPPHRPTNPSDVKRLKVVFDEKLGRDKPGKRLVRYQENPRENWGPMRKAQGTKPAKQTNT
ncbi:RNA methyltransferase tRNA(m5U54)methyltransferase [Saxophila tyrrhenica]|uniref:tRNA (guanine(26)-N(2))-dimethyltransferase n=1 Tax=Saxophila tyrrhenica TaxID=1690608 RepID=A0AAV9PC30_9PEZI|nr:RNA methyltransferase tRNA(m5U54)methyltransferase [Saxophila tyrrhenica]